MVEKHVSTKEISAGIFLIKSQIEKENEKLKTIFQVEVKKLINVEFTADFRGSEEIQLEGSNELVQVTNISPFSIATVATLLVGSYYSLKSKFKYATNICSIEVQRSFIQEYNLKLESQMKKCFSFLKEHHSAEMEIDDIKHLLKKNNMKYFDPEFPPIEVFYFCS